MNAKNMIGVAGIARRMVVSSVVVVGSIASVAVAVEPHDQYLSTGDNFYVGSWLPLETPAAIDASFDMLRDVFNTQQIYWRGLEDQLLTEHSPLAGERQVFSKYIDYASMLIQDRNINDYAIQAAHARGMKIWGQMGIYEFGTSPDMGTYGFPGNYEHPLRTENPDWVPIDKYGYRKQGGPLEYAYQGAREAVVDWVDNRLAQDGYDGVLFHTYPENFSMRFGDEFGFSEPIVQEFKNRYGVDIRKEAFNKEDWYALRGEYTTQFLQELKTAVGDKKVGVAISPVDTDKPQLWLSNQNFPNAGNITLDWAQWAANGSVDQLVVWGGTGWGPEAMNELIAGAGGTGVGLSVMTSSPYALTWNQFKAQGQRMTMASGDEWQYILESDIPVQPKSALTSTDQYKRMRTLAQIIEGTTSATTAEVLPLVNDPNLLNRRSALRALGKIGDAAAVIALESALNDSDSSVRNAAIYGLVDANRPESFAAIMSAVEQRGDFIFNEGAYLVLIQRPEWAASLMSTVRNSTVNDARAIALRSLMYMGNQLTSADADALIDAAGDGDDYVRSSAVDLLGQLFNDASVVQKLVDVMQSNDPITASRAASALSYSLQYHNPAADARRAELLGLIGESFESLGDGSSRADAAWAYRPTGLALLDVGAEGSAILKDYMNQREDRRLSEIAWETLYLTIRGHSIELVTEEQDAYAHFKRPRWDATTIAADDFDSKTVGATIHNQPAAQGKSWVILSGNQADQVISSEYNNGGNALKITRRVGDYQQLALKGYDFDSQAAELTMVTAKADWMHLNHSDAMSLAIGMGGLYGPSVYVDPAGEYRIWESDGTLEGGTYSHTGIYAGLGGWETIEIVLTFGLADDGLQLAGTYDVYLTRAAGGSLPAMARTLLADDVALFAVDERTLMSLIISNQTNGQTDSTTWWDNISFTVGGIVPTPVPEPATLTLAAATGLLTRRHRRP